MATQPSAAEGPAAAGAMAPAAADADGLQPEPPADAVVLERRKNRKLDPVLGNWVQFDGFEPTWLRSRMGC